MGNKYGGDFRQGQKHLDIAAIALKEILKIYEYMDNACRRFWEDKKC